MSDQWEFQDPKVEVPTTYKAYFSGLFKGIFPQNMALYGTNVPPIFPARNFHLFSGISPAARHF